MRGLKRHQSKQNWEKLREIVVQTYVTVAACQAQSLVFFKKDKNWKGRMEKNI